MNHSISDLIKIVKGKIEWWNGELFAWTDRVAAGEFENGKKYDIEQSMMARKEMEKATERLSFYYDMEEVLKIMTELEHVKAKVNSIIEEMGENKGREVEADYVKEMLIVVKSNLERVEESV